MQDTYALVKGGDFSMPNWTNIIKQLNQCTGKAENLTSSKIIRGGSINSAYHISMDTGSEYFVKCNSINFQDMFGAEHEALREFQQVSSLTIPKPVYYGNNSSECFIVMDYIELKGNGNSYQLGQGLAKMHKISAKQFGWFRNNTIGSTPQSNTLHDNWVDFWRNERLLPQFEMLYPQGYQKHLKPKADKLLAGLELFFEDHKPSPALLHGDLWSGNYAFDQNGRGVIFDPALYYGDREADIAMTELFGGFSQDFYSGYQEEFPLADGYKKRKSMYNLYHILNHANLFGSSYLNQADHLLDQLLA